MLGGSQVRLSAYDASRPPTRQPMTAPHPDISRGAKGRAFRQLQDALKDAGFDAGTTDGDYGKNTARAVKALQAAAGNIEVDGQYNEATHNHLASLLAQGRLA